MKKISVTKEEALLFHQENKCGKLETSLTKPLNTSRDLSLAYSPGVAYPCLEIERDPSLAYEYTSKGNMVAVISNGTAVLGLGNIGYMASKPVMEGKAVLFKKFADIDAIDVEVDCTKTDEFVTVVKAIGNTWGGINLEDIKAPECFIVEEKLKEMLDIPVFHDDQHGTAIVAVAGVINSLHINKKKIEDVKVVINGAGAAGIACLELLKTFGVSESNILLCDTLGVVYHGRESNMNYWKEKHATQTEKRTLAEAFDGADIAVGVSAKGAFTAEMVKSMAKNPIIFAMANPDPEITPDEANAIRSDAIVATGRSDYANQVNNVMCFPFLFRGALDTRATTINAEMKIAAANAIADLAREPIPSDVKKMREDDSLEFGANYIIPSPFDKRLLPFVSYAVAKAAIESGVARKEINLETYKADLEKRVN